MLAPQFSGADDLPGWPLPDGETVLAMTWQPGTNSIAVLVMEGRELGLRSLDLGTGKLKEMPSRALAQAKTEPAPSAAFSRDGQRLAILSASKNPLRGGTLLVLSQRDGKFEALSVMVPADFPMGGFAWGAADELYLSSTPYLNPEQAYSVGLLNVESGKFKGVVLKGNIDLISEVAVLPERQLVLTRAQGYRGEYPSEPVIASWDLAKSETALLHAEARTLSLEAVDPALASAVQRGGKSPERWLLTTDGSLRRMEKGLASRALMLRHTPDKKWMVLVIRGGDLTSELSPSEPYVAMQQVTTGRTLAIAAPCSEFVMSPDSRTVAALSKDKRKVYYYSLPDA